MIKLAKRIKLSIGKNDRESMPVELSEIKGIYRCPVTNAISGVYFLCHLSEVVYVGQAINVLARPFQHKNKTFDTIYFLPVAIRDLDKVEVALIKHLQPRYNKRLK
jgi:hypothetical protein